MIILLALTGCREYSSFNDPTGTTVPGARVVSGDRVTDTISSMPSARLVIRLADEFDDPVANAQVSFVVMRLPCASAPEGCLPLHIASGSSGPIAGSVVTDTTDSAGRIRLRVRMGLAAGTGRILIGATGRGDAADTAVYTVLPGALASISMSPRDTVIELGDVAAVQTSPLDRGNNLTTAAIVFSTSGSPVIETGAPGTVTAMSVGQGFLRATARGGQVRDSVRIAVVPNGRIATTTPEGMLRLTSPTGSNARDAFVSRHRHDWSPTGDRIVFVDDRGSLNQQQNYGLSIADTLGNSTALAVPPRSNWPQYSRDGQWIYFMTEGTTYQVYRIHPDGTGLDSLMPGAFPSPSPDGAQVAVILDEGIWVGDVATLTGTILPATAAAMTSLRWSPDGQRLAYRDAFGVAIATIGGGVTHPVLGSNIRGMAWSPDSRWLLWDQDGKLRLFDRITSSSYQLPLAGGYPAWKPVP